MESSLRAFADTPRSAIYENIYDTIGRTPIIKLNHMSPKEGVDVYVKLESENPGGSVKDRLAVGAIEWAEKHGQLKPGQTIVEASSGNTGISLAMVCAKKGYPLVCVMSESFSIERRKLMRFLGARVVLTDPAHKATGMVIKAKELADEHGWFWPNQFENEANAWIHRETTGPEIVQAFNDAGKTLDHFVCAYGTGGTLLGVGSYLKEFSPETTVHCCEPDNAPMIFSEIKTSYPENGDPSSSFDVAHPVWRPHLFQGWAADFIPKLVNQASESKVYDKVVHPSGVEAMATCRELARKEGIFSGTSGGGILTAALNLAKECSSGTSILALIPDTGERYLSTPLFDDIPADMTEEEMNIATSTPSKPPPAPGLPEVLPEATEWVQKKIDDHKVVAFMLKYCEFCWTLTRFLDALGVEYERIDIDSFEYAKNDMGNKYRSALSAMTDCKTFPQFFVNGKFVGGAVDACMMWKKDELGKAFQEAGITGGNCNFNGYEGDPFEFLPKWMTKNPLRSK
ncbi:cysteine synthase [Nitzschia inconspicua]|uniref:Cysteine synthase n=1 Tax=Nitzschia inconspicua TaxID=303405 RepID=A0A9K3PC03_9STRA|nr:cysteine synthase [Nitzschia inconspicua]